MPNLFPYTNTHELNLDWILQVVKDFQTKYTNFDQALADALAAIESGKVEALDEISTDLTAALNDIEASQTAALTAIGNTKDSALADIGTALTSATSAISALNTTVQAEITTLKNTSISQITTAQGTAISAITASQNHATTIIEQLYNTLPSSAQDIISRLDLLDNIITGNTMESFTWLQGDYVYPDGATPPTPPAIYTESEFYNYLVSNRYMEGVGGRRLRVITDGTIVMRYLLNWRNTPPGGSPGAYVPGQADYFTSTYLDLLIPLDVTAISLTLAKPGLTDTLSPTDIEGHIEIQWITDFVGQRIIAPKESSLTADIARLTNQLFFYDGVLYKALADIDIGDTIVLSGAGANCEETTVGYELYKELDDIADALSAANSSQSGVTSLQGDMTTAQDDINDLKSTLDGLEKIIYIDGDACPVRNTTDNTALTANGNSTSNTNAEVVTYIVNAGDDIHIIAAGGTAGVFQFSSDSAISASYRVGETITTEFDGYVTVPQNARFLHVSKLKSATGNSVTQYHVVINSMMDDIHDAMYGAQPIYKIDSNADFVKGKVGSDYHTIVSDNYRVVNSNIIYPDRDIQFCVDSGYQYSIITYDENGNWLGNDTGFITVNYSVPHGYGFIATIRKYPEQQVTDKYEYLNALKVFTQQGNLVDRMSNTVRFSSLVKTPWIQEAHRGITSGTIVENTIASYEEAYKAGFTRIECDIRLTSDNEIVVVHDETISGTVNGVATTYTVADTPWNTLKQLVLADDPVYGEQTVPKFADVLAWAYYRKVDLNVDFKDGIVQISDAALLIKRNGMSGKVTYNTNSYSTESSDSVLQHDPKAYILFVYNSNIIAELNAKNYDKQHIIIYPVSPNQTIINEIRDNGYTLLLADVYNTTNLAYKADIVQYVRQTVYEINAINQSFMDSLDY